MLILAGRWEGLGFTILALETVCILARRPLKDELPFVVLERQFQERMAALQSGGDATDLDEWAIPNPKSSYFRVGLAQGAGSIDGWKRAGVPAAEKVFLL